MNKVKLSFISVMGCLVLVATCGILVFLWATPTDQELTYSTFLGGNGMDRALDIAWDDVEGAVYVTGFTNSDNFPVTNSEPFSGASDFYVAKFDPYLAGPALWITWIGGIAQEPQNRGVALDIDYVYVVGGTRSWDFPTTDDSGLVGDNSMFVARLNKIDGSIDYSTIIGEGGPYEMDDMGDIVVHDGYVYLTGRTRDPDFFVPYGLLDPVREHKGGEADAFVAKFRQTAVTGIPLVLEYGTFLGGSGFDRAISIAVDGLGDAYVMGKTDSEDFFTTEYGFQESLMGSIDYFVTKLDFFGNIIYSTYLGGPDDNAMGDIAVGSGYAYVTGRAASSAISPTFGAVGYSGRTDAFLAVFDPSSASGPGSLLYFTYLGGSSQDEGSSIALDALGNAYVCGGTHSSDLNTALYAYDNSYNGGGGDAFLAKFSPTGPGFLNLESLTYLGSKGVDGASGIALHTNSGDLRAYLSGITTSKNFPITPGAFDESHNGGRRDAFVSVLTFTGAALPDTTPPATVSNLATGGTTSNSIALTWTAPGDDGNTGTASQYDIRYSTSVIITDTDWGTATQCTGEPSPSPAGTPESFTVTGLSSSTTYYFALKTADEVPNLSGLSNSPSGTTEAAGSQTMHVFDIDMSLKRAGPNVNAIATVTIVDSDGFPVSGATVSGSWSGATSDSDSGVTDSNGQVTLRSDRLKNPSSQPIFTFTVTGVAKDGWIYDPSKNVMTFNSIF